MCQFSGAFPVTEKNIKKQTEINLSFHFLNSCFELTWIEIGQGRLVTWQLLHKCSPSPHISIYWIQFKLLEDEQSALIAFYAGAQTAHVGQIWNNLLNSNMPRL